MTSLTTPEQINAFRLLTLRGAVKLEAIGMKRRGRSVIIVDGRLSSHKHHDTARVEGKRRGYPFYKLCKGASFTQVSKATTLHGTGL